MFLTALVAFIPLIHGVQELGDQLPMTESAAKTLSEKSILAFQEGLENLLAIPDEERTYNNTIRAWDSLNGNLAQAQYCLSTLSQVHPEKSVRDCLDEEYQKTCQTFCNALAAHPEIYGAFAAVKDSSLSEMERYYLDQLFIDCECSCPTLKELFLPRHNRKSCLWRVVLTRTSLRIFPFYMWPRKIWLVSTLDGSTQESKMKRENIASSAIPPHPMPS